VAFRFGKVDSAGPLSATLATLENELPCAPISTDQVPDYSKINFRYEIDSDVLFGYGLINMSRLSIDDETRRRLDLSGP
jgi:hypothetical protein